MSGLNGLGEAGLKDGVLQISNDGNMEDNYIDTGMIETNALRFNSSVEFSIYLRNWFTQLKGVEISEVSGDIKSLIRNENIFNLRVFQDLANTVYTIVPCFNMDETKSVINILGNYGVSQVRYVLVAYAMFSRNDREIAHRLNTELIGTEDIYNINMAEGPFIGQGYTLSDKLQRLLSSEKPSRMSMNSGLEMNTMGNSMGEVINDGIVQIKQSLRSLFNGVGAGMLAGQGINSYNYNGVPNQLQNGPIPNQLNQGTMGNTFGENYNTTNGIYGPNYSIEGTGIQSTVKTGGVHLNKNKTLKDAMQEMEAQSESDIAQESKNTDVNNKVSLKKAEDNG